MQWCEDHWSRLRAAIEERGLSEFVAKDGKRAIQNVKSEIETERVTMASFDPLMGAFWAINNNTLSTLSNAGSAMYMMQSPDEPEDAVDPERFPEAKGRTWPRCPLCYLGLAHELTCKEQKCKLPKVDGYAFFIEKAADEQLETLKRLRAEEASA